MLKNHRNDTYTRLARNTARTTHAYKKARESRQQKKTLNAVDQELVSLKESQKENAAHIKELKSTKSTITRKGKSSKAESNSSGKVAVTGDSKRKQAKTALKVATVKSCTPFHSVCTYSIILLFILDLAHRHTPSTPPANLGCSVEILDSNLSIGPPATFNLPPGPQTVSDQLSGFDDRTMTMGKVFHLLRLKIRWLIHTH